MSWYAANEIIQASNILSIVLTHLWANTFLSETAKYTARKSKFITDNISSKSWFTFISHNTSSKKRE
jgi:hypothetical protein